jgi:hypothetical protein
MAYVSEDQKYYCNLHPEVIGSDKGTYPIYCNTDPFYYRFVYRKPLWDTYVDTEDPYYKKIYTDRIPQ